ncbi:MAG: Tic20 family protein [Nostoc sp. SerVER01]|uniref:Tic20 family protein n=1 Tax=Nostoc sp. CCY 9925 TaxID=3103865 RepID=UPI002ADB52F3|nr:Tic20 family protein [Nostoc sp. SerVER01]MDZ8025945.1 Tic20 family protein [Nostoc sp. DedQUE11]MDZ8075397.1 Tic20 family protein [Nostoc sp. DedQUE01]MDZ8083756.1 Tic20 family protein [Nostoc sp. DcaGUA01]MDZ8238376.1 Tic20 family protein [Nostoc sp. ChiQUE01a]
MTWRGSTTVPDRIFACLPYLLPLIDGLVFGRFLFTQFPVLQVLLLPLQPVLIIYGSLGQLGQLIVFFALFLLVVRNEKISHFIRFNTMQAILLDIVIFLCSILVRILGQVPGTSFAIETVANTIFLGVVVAVGYSTIQSLIGRYAEIPAISDAVYMQVR